MDGRSHRLGREPFRADASSRVRSRWAGALQDGLPRYLRGGHHTNETSCRSHPARLCRLSCSALRTRALAYFYRRLLGWEVIDDEPDWVRLSPTGGGPGLSFQTEDGYAPPVWPAAPGKQQMMRHLDLRVDDLDVAGAHAEASGATLATYQPQDAVRVYLDPAGRPFCLFLRGARAQTHPARRSKWLVGQPFDAKRSPTTPGTGRASLGRALPAVPLAHQSSRSSCGTAITSTSAPRRQTVTSVRRPIASSTIAA